MLKTTNELVFVGVNNGVSQKSGNPYSFITFANPLTFGNFTVSHKNPNFSAEHLQPGQRVQVNFDVVDRFGNTNLLVTDISVVKG